MRDLSDTKAIHSSSKSQDKPRDVLSLVSEFGGRYSTQLGIQLNDLDATEIYSMKAGMRAKITK
ncbi:MAG: hypothetical protein ABL861_04070 [Nitrosomonas sp.]